MGIKKPMPADDGEFPEPLLYLWSWFLQHSMGLAAVSSGMPRVTWEGLAAWSSQMRIELEPWEAETIVLLGSTRANLHAERMAEMRRNSK